MRRRSSPPFNFHNNGSGDKWSPPDDKKSIKSIRQSVEEKPKEKSKEYVPKCCAKSAALLPEEQKYHPKIRPETAPGTAEIVDVDSRGNDVVTPTSDRTCTPPVPPIRISKTKIGITVNPSPIPKPVQKVTPPIEKRPKKKWPYNWRLEQLAKPAHFTSKYVPRVEQRIGPFIKKRIKLDPELSFYMNQLFRPHIRVLQSNIKEFGPIRGQEYVDRMEWLIEQTWETIYNYYKLIKKEHKERAKSMKPSKFNKAKFEAKLKEMYERIAQLAIAKQVKRPPKSEKPKVIFSSYDRLSIFATAKSYEGALTPRPLPNPLSPNALKYVATQNIIKLAAVPARWLNVPQPLVPGAVRKSALFYNVTKRIEELAMPIVRNIKVNPEEIEDPWAIPKNALTYRATARIIELAKPVERD